MEDKLMNQTFTIQSNRTQFLPGQSVIFLVTMQIRSRFNTSLKVQFYKDHYHFATLEDSNTTALSINCKQGEMSIVSTYGRGCILAIQFEHDFVEEGSFVPEVFISNEEITLQQKLKSAIMIVNRLEGARLQLDKIITVNHTTKVTLNLTVPSISMTVSWLVVNEEGDFVTNKSSSHPYLIYSFPEPGFYHIFCNASNIINTIHTRKSIHVLEPVLDLNISCGEKHVLQTDEVFNCLSDISQGTDVEFKWRVFSDSNYIPTTVSNSNVTSVASIVLTEPGIYNISVSASNDVSTMLVYLDNLIKVEVPLTYVIIQQRKPNILGEKTDLKIIISENKKSDVELEFDFGQGRVQYNYTYELSNGAYYLDYIFDMAGIHNVKVFAFNGVSEVASYVEVIVERMIENLEITMDRAPAIGVPAIFVLKTEGKYILFTSCSLSCFMSINLCVMSSSI